MGQSSSGVRRLGPLRRCCCNAKIHQAARLPRRAADFGRGQLLPGRGLTTAVLWDGSTALPAACAWQCCHLTSLVLGNCWLLADGNGFRVCAAPVTASSVLRDCWSAGGHTEPREAAWDGDEWQEDVQGMAEVPEVIGSFLWPLSPVPAGRCPLLGAEVWMSLCGY